MNLPYALGVPTSEEVVPITSNLDYIEEKTGARPGSGWGLMMSLNPDVSDVVERFGMRGPGGCEHSRDGNCCSGGRWLSLP